ncbi:MAG: acyl carrier protein [Pirellulales bacterium]|nr:acyl carrier protein [Pirellulales bacterium]
MPTTDTILSDLKSLLADMTSDWDTSFEGEITPQTRLITDLGFESIDVVQLVTAIEEHYGRRDFRFEELLMEGGTYVNEVSVGRIVAFLERHLNK